MGRHSGYFSASYWCDCINPDMRTREMQSIIENSVKIGESFFTTCCIVDEKLIQNMREYPQDYEFYYCPSHLGYKHIYWYRHSGIEYFYK